MHERNKPQHVKIARKALEMKLRQGLAPQLPETLPAELLKPGAAFVSLKKQGALRGCIGTVQPTRNNLAEEIAYNALSAGFNDPRFPPLAPEELDEITISVDVLTEPEKIDDLSQLDPVRYGVIVRKGLRSGLLLPNLEGIDTVEKQLAIAKQKAGIDEQEPVELYRFEVQRYV